MLAQLEACSIIVLLGVVLMKEVDKRLDRMIEIAESENLTLDHVVEIMGRCDQRTFRAFSDNPSTLPRKI
tara:strand:- start:3690 stop:3899 length:210 start_codon:yes stop_codon:yes gene_type:complete